MGTGVQTCALPIYRASGSGGGIFSNRAAPEVHATALYDNTAWSVGGAIALTESSPFLRRLKIYSNDAIEGGAISFHNQSRGLLAESTIFGTNAAAGGALLPMLTLGVPGSGTTAVLLALLMTLNITPGPTLFTDQPEVIWGLIASLLIANVVLLLMNVPMVKVFVRVLQVPPAILLPGVTMISFIGFYSLSGSYFDLLLMFGFGFLGYVLRKLDIPTVPVILGILLGGNMEDALRRAMVISDGDGWYLFSTPIAIGLWVAAIAGFIAPMFMRGLLQKPQLVTD